MTSTQRSAAAGLSRVGEIVRRHDPDRFFTVLFAPRAAQEALFTLYAFNHELARAHEVAREPALALIRLQWWREVVEGALRPHEVATPLAKTLSTGALRRDRLLAMIEAREAETEPAETMEALLDRLSQGPGSLAVAAGEALGATAAESARLRVLGTGVGLAGLVRNIPAHARMGRCQIPTDLLARHGLTADGVIVEPGSAGMTVVMSELVLQARTVLGQPARLRSQIIAAGLPAVLARRDIRNPPGSGRGIAGKLTVGAAALRGRV